MNEFNNLSEEELTNIVEQDTVISLGQKIFIEMVAKVAFERNEFRYTYHRCAQEAISAAFDWLQAIKQYKNKNES